MPLWERDQYQGRSCNTFVIHKFHFCWLRRRALNLKCVHVPQNIYKLREQLICWWTDRLPCLVPKSFAAPSIGLLPVCKHRGGKIGRSCHMHSCNIRYMDRTRRLVLSFAIGQLVAIERVHENGYIHQQKIL